MGKKGRRTRWRTLTITDEHSDSEESNTTTSGHRVPNGYPPKSYYSRFTYSSQSTPTRRYQCDGTKSTRSSSTASENKITFNEDEYTRITTPRQDVLFKKGYLNKPKTYQTQTSTGNSTTSTGNSTGNGTPDHQSTDLEYESQFVFPNGFVDQNGIYYVNSFEPYPVMVYNPPTYYPEYTNVKTKRCSTGSLTESTSPNNEETSQDLSQSETPSNVSELNQVYNVIYPGYYYGACQAQDAVCEPEPRRVKKRRRRKLSRSKQEGTTSESSDEIFSDAEETKTETPAKTIDQNKDVQKENELKEENVKEEEPKEENVKEETKPVTEVEATASPEETQDENAQKEEESKDGKPTKYDLKPDAEEFVPRAYRQPETIPIEPANVQFIKIPSNFVPVPILNPMGEFNAFIPPGIPINFIPQNYVNFVPYKQPVHVTDEKEEEKKEETKETVEVPKNQIDIAKIVSKLEEAAKEQDEKKEETQKSGGKKRHKYQKVELRSREEKVWNKVTSSPKKEEAKVVRNYSDTLKKSVVQPCERHERNMEKAKAGRVREAKENVVKSHQRMERTPPKSTNEWISVSRKKRKNKNVEEIEDVEEKTEQEVEENLERIEETPQVPQEPTPPPLPPPKETIQEPTTPPPPSPPSPPPPSPTLPIVQEPPVIEIKPEETKEEKKPKKKSRKNHTKSTPPAITKRVIITDVDLSVPEVKKEVEEEKEVKIEEEIKPIEEVKVVEETKPEEEKAPEKVEVAEEDTEKVEIVEEEKKESTEKKSKKKKKKVGTKSTILSRQSSSNNALNVSDDSYDFLLDESLEKTNLEVSQELDKMIQRGMYSSLEEKIKSMNIESNDNFFKTIISNISSRESSVEKNHPYIKTPDFGRLMTTAPIKPQQTPDPKPGDFLGESTTPDSCGGGDAAEAAAPSDPYPITRAVKEWMTKTRETTPDVEILKSPSAIFKEFGVDDDEVTVYTCDDRKTSVSSVEEAEEVLETYESQYGKNEDFLKIQAEVEELKNSYPKHGNLPYRAICCSIM
ncbi:titin-like isoform X2 [Zophobas morio]|uniref:titin-like isoform X2 n=1 Tax=Zophobas morio TaxID=2755281 RepID=UPI00308318C3